MTPPQIALYARVSSTHQAEAGTIASQLAALRARIAADGGVIAPAMEFLDDGQSGSSLLRPGLERLRDAVHAGEVDRLYVLAPDRLARKYAYQVVLLEEFQRAGAEVVFLDHAGAQSAEDELLRQVQGMLAEYERAKILERTRRGKRHAARAGAVSVLSGAPYGYCYVAKDAGGGEARYDVVAAEADVVREVFRWVGQERATIEEVCRRLEQLGAVTRTGRTVWNRSTVGEMLRNPAYAGAAPFGRTRLGEPRLRVRPIRGHPGPPKRPCSIHATPADEWICVPVPAIVAPELFEAVQEQLRENRQRVRRQRAGHQYLLQGLIVCGLCGYGFHGRTVAPRGPNHRGYVYYRCNSGNAARRTGLSVCPNAVVRAEVLDAVIWDAVCALLKDPARVADEYRQRSVESRADGAEEETRRLCAQREAVDRGIGRLIDSYAEGLIDKGEFEPRIRRLKQRAGVLATQAQAQADAQSVHRELALLVGRLEEFAERVAQGLEHADWTTRREIVRALVRRIEVDASRVRIVFRVGPSPFVLRPGRGDLQHCPPRRIPAAMVRPRDRAHHTDPARPLLARHAPGHAARARRPPPHPHRGVVRQATPTFSDALAAVRRQWWRAATTSATSPREADMLKLPRRIVRRLSEAACYAA